MLKSFIQTILYPTHLPISKHHLRLTQWHVHIYALNLDPELVFVCYILVHDKLTSISLQIRAWHVIVRSGHYFMVILHRFWIFIFNKWVPFWRTFVVLSAVHTNSWPYVTSSPNFPFQIMHLSIFLFLLCRLSNMLTAMVKVKLPIMLWPFTSSKYIMTYLPYALPCKLIVLWLVNYFCSSELQKRLTSLGVTYQHVLK